MRMAKRVATSVLTKDNCEDEDEPEDAGIFQKAPDEELKGRIIKRGIRRIAEDPNAHGGSSAFMGFSGFGKKATNPNFSFTPSIGNLVTNGNVSSVSEDDPEKSGKAAETRAGDYYRQLKSLNECFQQWIQKHSLKSLYCDFTPVCRDYERHLKDIQKQFPLPNGSLSVNDQKTETSILKSSIPKHIVKPEGFSFGSQPLARDEEKPAISMSPESILIKDPEPSKVKFSFSAAATNSPLSKSALKKEDEVVIEDENDSPPKNEFIPVEEQDSLYSKRCKLFFKKDLEYVDKGIGVLYLKKLDTKTQLLIRADTSLGNVLLNILLNKSLPIERTGKNNVLVVCIPNPPIHSTKQEPIPMLIRVKTSQDADELFSKLVEHAT